MSQERVLTGHRCTSQYALSWQSSTHRSTWFRSFPALESHKPRWRPERCRIPCSLMDPLPDGPPFLMDPPFLVDPLPDAPPFLMHPLPSAPPFLMDPLPDAPPS